MTGKYRDPLDLNVNQLLELYLQDDHDRLSEEFLRHLDYFRDHVVCQVNPALRLAINSFVKAFLFLFTQPRYQVSARYAAEFVSRNRLISNLVAISSAGTTDAFQELLRDQPVDLVKALTLNSARSRVKLDRRALFDAQPELASLWYSAYAALVSTGPASPTVYENLKEHFAFQHPDWRINYCMEEVYFGASYVEPGQDRIVKQRMNAGVQRLLESQPLPAIENRPDPRKIAVISASWSAGHSVYRNYYHLVKALREKYHLTFCQLGRAVPAETSLFDEVRVLDSPDDLSDVAALARNDFQVIYYPDVGMSDASILLANLRLAPIQVCSPGHSVSTWGSQIDYFVSGADVELPAGAERHYSERLVLLPGMGVVHNRPNYQPRGAGPAADGIVINGPWTCVKINAPLLGLLKRILERAERKITFRLFTARTSYADNGHLPLLRELQAQLGAKHVELLHGLSYDDYLARMEHGHFTLDSYPFGGCNTIADSLLLRLPTLAWEGDRWFNRIGPQMLRLVGVPECVATGEAEYVDLALRLIHDDGFRESVRHKLQGADLDATIYSTDDARYFLRAMDYLITHHAELQRQPDRTPIRIPRDPERFASSVA
jgi:hypothetical protein